MDASGIYRQGIKPIKPTPVVKLVCKISPVESCLIPGPDINHELGIRHADLAFQLRGPLVAFMELLRIRKLGKRGRTDHCPFPAVLLGRNRLRDNYAASIVPEHPGLRLQLAARRT